MQQGPINLALSYDLLLQFFPQFSQFLHLVIFRVSRPIPAMFIFRVIMFSTQTSLFSSHWNSNSKFHFNTGLKIWVYFRKRCRDSLVKILANTISRLFSEYADVDSECWVVPNWEGSNAEFYFGALLFFILTRVK